MERGRTVHTKVLFNPIPLLLGTGFFAACTAWLALGPATSGPVGSVMSSNGAALTIIAVSVSFVLTLLFGYHTTRMALGMPALIADDQALQLYVMPVERLCWLEIDDVKLEVGKLLIVTQSGRTRRINLALLRAYDSAVVEIQAKVAKQQGMT